MKVCRQVELLGDTVPLLSSVESISAQESVVQEQFVNILLHPSVPDIQYILGPATISNLHTLFTGDVSTHLSVRTDSRSSKNIIVIYSYRFQE